MPEELDVDVLLVEPLPVVPLVLPVVLATVPLVVDAVVALEDVEVDVLVEAVVVLVLPEPLPPPDDEDAPTTFEPHAVTKAPRSRLVRMTWRCMVLPEAIRPCICTRYPVPDTSVKPAGLACIPGGEIQSPRGRTNAAR